MLAMGSMNMLAMGSIFFPLIVASLKTQYVLLYVDTNPTIKQLVFDNMDTTILRVHVHFLLIV